MNRLKMTQKGFTLIELILIVLIIGILAAVALPSYQNYAKRARIADATSALSDYRVRYENYFLDNRAYPAASSTCLTSTITAPGQFAITCASTTSTYTITATGSGQMSGFNYTITQSNVKGSTTPWGNSTTCWVRGSGGAC